MKPEHAIKIIMAQHWDMWACDCWICAVGRENGIGVYASLVRKKQSKPHVNVTGSNSALYLSTDEKMHG